MEKRFTDQSLLLILDELRTRVDGQGAGEVVSFEVCRPETKGARQGGGIIDLDGHPVRVRGMRSWVDLAEVLGCRLLTPEIVDDVWMRLSFQKLDRGSSWHDVEPVSPTEKYGVDSSFARIDKREDPTFLNGFIRSFRCVTLPAAARVLDVGINTGDEFAIIRDLLTTASFDAKRFVGIDHSESAIGAAKKRFVNDNVTFHCVDINRLDDLALGRFDLLVSIGTLQSPGIDSKRVLMSLVQNALSDTGAVILGFPNCRYIDGEVVYGAKVRNYTEPELSLLIKDVHFAKRYLQQHRFKVTLFGKNYLFVSGVRL